MATLRRSPGEVSGRGAWESRHLRWTAAGAQRLRAFICNTECGRLQLLQRGRGLCV